MGVVGEEVGVLLVLEVGDVGVVHHVLVLVGREGVEVVGWLEALVVGWLVFIFIVKGGHLLGVHVGLGVPQPVVYQELCLVCLYADVASSRIWIVL